MADGQGDGAIAPRRSLGGPILPPPPPELAEKEREAEQKRAAAAQAAAERQAQREAKRAEKDARRDATARQREEARKEAEVRRRQETERQERAKQAQEKTAREEAERKRQEAAERQRERESARATAAPVSVAPAAKKTASSSAASSSTSSSRSRGPRRTRRAQLRLVQVDAWSVMKTSFLLSIALGIVLVVAVAIIWSVLGAAGVWTSVNSIVQQAVGTDNGTPFDIEQYVGASRVLGFTMIVAVLDVILITAIATLAAFLYNLSAALLGGIEVTLAEDS